jgi:hypothetical protein
MRRFAGTFAYWPLLLMLSEFLAASAGSPAKARPPGPATFGTRESTAGTNSTLTSFVPLWLSVPKFQPSVATEAAAVPSRCYSMIWQQQWQKEIGVTPEQQKALAEIKSKALAESKQQTEHFESLSAEERKAEVKSRSGKPAPWRQELDDQVRNQIETILTPTQLRVLKEYSFPRYAVSRLYDADLRRQIDFSPQQAEQFHLLTKERMATFQEQYLVHADAVWGILTPQQRDALPEIVRQHLLSNRAGCLQRMTATSFMKARARFPPHSLVEIVIDIHLSQRLTQQDGEL